MLTVPAGPPWGLTNPSETWCASPTIPTAITVVDGHGAGVILRGVAPAYPCADVNRQHIQHDAVFAVRNRKNRLNKAFPCKSTARALSCRGGRIMTRH